MTGSPPMVSRRVSQERSSTVPTRRSPGSQAGTPGTSSSQLGSCGAASAAVAPLSGSAASTRAAVWSRDWTSSVSGPTCAQTTLAR